MTEPTMTLRFFSYTVVPTSAIRHVYELRLCGTPLPSLGEGGFACLRNIEGVLFAKYPPNPLDRAFTPWRIRERYPRIFLE